MGKIKISLASGNMLEKPLVSAFKGNTGTYVVLDNEVNGTMGLPIILVSKYENNRLIKINDQNEWNAVKENLRNIIAGNQVDYIALDEQIPADDMFFSQLTLPIASFEALKNNYKVVAPEEVKPAEPEIPEVSIPEPTVMPEPVAPAVESQVVQNDTNVQLEQNIAPTNEIAAPIMPEIPATPVPEPVAPVVEPIPQVEEKQNIDFSADKEAFMKACENMFDALVAKFNK